MSLPELRGTGRMITDPRTGTAKTGAPWCSALIKFPVWKKTDDGKWEEQPDAPVASVIAYDDLAGQLAGYSKGDAVGVHGTTKLAIWKDRPQFAVTATQVWTPEKTDRGSRSREAQPPAATSTGNGLAEARAAASASLRQFDARTQSAEGRAA